MQFQRFLDDPEALLDYRYTLRQLILIDRNGLWEIEAVYKDNRFDTIYRSFYEADALTRADELSKAFQMPIRRRRA